MVSSHISGKLQMSRTLFPFDVILLPVDHIHILQGYFTDTGANLQRTQYQGTYI